MSRRTLLPLLIAGAFALAGCRSSGVDAHWGEAYWSNFHRSNADPALATENASLDGPEGTDGETASASTRRYRRGAETGRSDTREAPFVITGGTGQ